MPKEPSKKPAPDPDEPTPDVDEETTEEKPLVVEIDGHEYTVDPAAQDDFELLDDLNEMTQTGDPARAPAILKRMLGREQTRVALDRLRDKDTGRIPIDVGSEFVVKLLDGLDPN